MNAELLVRGRGGRTRRATPAQVIDAARAVLDRQVRPGVALGNPLMAADYLTMRLAGRGHEVFTVLYLDGRNRLIACSELFRGTISGATVHPREVVKEALKYNAAAVIACHNHPSGVAEPSAADETITERLRDALALVEIELLDHVIVAGGTSTSLAARGWCSPARTVEALQFRAAADRAAEPRRRRPRKRR